jgi:choline-sulfatase
VKKTNFLFIFSDEHTRDITGCYGDKVVRTPNIDALAARGTRFTNAYTNCPICVPARASLATGRYVHELGNWDNANAFTGSVRSWHQRLRESGHRVTSIGKLHFRSTRDDNGFSDERLPLHILDGKGDLLGLIRRPKPAPRGNMPSLARDSGPGETPYNDYDRKICASAIDWLRSEAPKHRDRPWALFVSFIRPHFPLLAPPAYYAMYDPESIPPPRLRAAGERPAHPVLAALRGSMCYDDHFTPERVKVARASYYALVTFLDDLIGKVLATLNESGLGDDTRILYTTDHGDNLGARGFWGKSVMYEESTALPMIMAGPDIPVGRTVSTPVTLADVYATAVETVGERLDAEERGLPSRSLLGIANGETPTRTILSEYHSASSITGYFMIRHGKWKYVHYAGGYPPQLFDLEADPGEAHDLGTSPAHAAARAECEAKLRALCDPEAVNARAFADQARMIAENGGIEALLKRGDFGYTPAPGETPRFA